MKKKILLIFFITMQMTGCGRQAYFKIGDVSLYNVKKINDGEFAITNLVHADEDYGIYITFKKTYFTQSDSWLPPSMPSAVIEPGIYGSKEKIESINIYLYNKASASEIYYITSYLFNDRSYVLTGGFPDRKIYLINSSGYDFKSIEDFIWQFNANSENVRGIQLSDGDGFVLWLDKAQYAKLSKYQYVGITIEFSGGRTVEGSTAEELVFD